MSCVVSHLDTKWKYSNRNFSFCVTSFSSCWRNLHTFFCFVIIQKQTCGGTNSGIHELGCFKSIFFQSLYTYRIVVYFLLHEFMWIHPQRSGPPEDVVFGLQFFFTFLMESADCGASGTFTDISLWKQSCQTCLKKPNVFLCISGFKCFTSSC